MKDNSHKKENTEIYEHYFGIDKCKIAWNNVYSLESVLLRILPFNNDGNTAHIWKINYTYFIISI